MSTKALIPGNSQRARLTALNAFERFATTEDLTVKTICEFIGKDESGDMLYLILDKFAMFLAFRETSKGSLLSKNSVASYFGNVKSHLLELFPALNAVSGRRLQKIASVLDKCCAKRGSDYTQQAPPCTKIDLRSLCMTIGKCATSGDEYKDIALLNLLWYLLGRSSDTLSLMKNQVAVYPGGCLYISFKRMKSASSQGASLFYDPNDFSSCPIHALAVATIMQTSPSEFLLDQLPRETQYTPASPAVAMPFRELLEVSVQLPSRKDDLAAVKEVNEKVVSVPGIHAYANRVLQKWGPKCVENNYRLSKGLTSHSFRRGAAQNANGNSDISPPWILDRGGWSMTAVSKAFNYIVSTTHEDQQVGKILELEIDTTTSYIALFRRNAAPQIRQAPADSLYNGKQYFGCFQLPRGCHRTFDGRCDTPLPRHANACPCCSLHQTVPSNSESAANE